MEISELQRLSSQVRRDIIRMVSAVQSGHPGGSLGCTDFFTCMYYKILNVNPEKFTMDGNGEDVFFLSNGHISPVFYSVLAHRGYFPVKELATFRLINSRLQGHPSVEKNLPGVRISSGSLGQGLSVAIGAALSKKLNGDKNLIYTLHGDGELQEGQIWEAAMFASAKKIDNLIATVDFNHKQIDGDTDDVLPMGDLTKKWQAFGWEVLDMNGHSYEDILATMAKAKSLTGKGKPVVVVMTTIMGNGVDFMMHTHKWHGSPPNKSETETALAQLEETLGDY